MDIILITPQNIDQEHICCAISDSKGDPCVSAKKAWMKERFQDGLVFRRLDARGKMFIETLPAEKAWCPIQAPGYLFIDCFWVSGQFQGQGYASRLLEETFKDAKARGKAGLAVLSSVKKQPFLSDPKFLKYKGFQVADTAKPYFELLYLPLDKDAATPSFRPCCKEETINDKGMVIYYSHQCPFTIKYVPLLQGVARRMGQEITLKHINSLEQAQAAPTPFPSYSFFDRGQFVTQEIFSEKKMEKYIQARSSTH